MRQRFHDAEPVSDELTAGATTGATTGAPGVRVLVVTFEAGFLAKAYVEDTGLRWPILVDEDRALYQAYGMERGSWWHIWGPATWLAYARALRGGQHLVESHADAAQLGGNVLIDPEGVVRLHHVGKGPADRPHVDRIAELIEAPRP